MRKAPFFPRSVRPAKYCAGCGTRIAGPETDQHTYNRVKYCPVCAKERKLWQNARYARLNRREKAENRRLLFAENRRLKTLLNLYRTESDALRKRIGKG